MTGLDRDHTIKNRFSQIPRQYLSDLETQVEELTRENQELRTRCQQAPVNSEASPLLERDSPARRAVSNNPAADCTISDGDSRHLQDLVRSVRDVVVEPSQEPRFLGASSGITLAKMVMASIRTEALPRSPLSFQQSLQGNSATTPASVSAAEASLPPRPAADHLVQVYFQYRTPHLPILERSQVEEAIESAYHAINGHKPLDRVVERDIFTTYMIFAITLCNVPNPSGGTGRVMRSEGCFRSAIGFIEKVVTHSKSDLETLRAVLFLA